MLPILGNLCVYAICACIDLNIISGLELERILLEDGFWCYCCTYYTRQLIKTLLGEPVHFDSKAVWFCSSVGIMR